MPSKKSQMEIIVPPQETPTPDSPTPTGEDGMGRLLPSSKKPPTMDEARESDEVRNPRLSIRYQAKELSARGSQGRRSSTPFDRARIGTHTRHGLMPGPRGFSAAKINQDRGVVCWPFNGSYNQALFCVFDGHGSKGERASEFCMKTVPELLEADSEQLKIDIEGCLSKNICKTDELLFAHPELGKLAMTCGTTSTVLYMHGSDIYTACSGDSRAVKGIRKGGKIEAEDLSYDHKPDLPEERARIVSRGGTVSDGCAGRPARVWAHGRIGLAMSRSIGDGECKSVGVIPDPSITHHIISPPQKPNGDGDLFIIVASDGVWEFIESAEACQIVSKHKNATDACGSLVQEAAARWKRFEGSYRDDITAIVAFLPFLEAGWIEEDADGTQNRIEGHDDANDDSGQVYINMGKQGLSYGTNATPSSPGQSDTVEGDDEGEDGDEQKTAEEEEFAQRRLSVHNPFDEDWNDVGEEEEDEDDEPQTKPKVSTQRA